MTQTHSGPDTLPSLIQTGSAALKMFSRKVSTYSLQVRRLAGIIEFYIKLASLNLLYRLEMYCQIFIRGSFCPLVFRSDRRFLCFCSNVCTTKTTEFDKFCSIRFCFRLSEDIREILEDMSADSAAKRKLLGSNRRVVLAEQISRVKSIQSKLDLFVHKLKNSDRSSVSPLHNSINWDQEFDYQKVYISLI